MKNYIINSFVQYSIIDKILHNICYWCIMYRNCFNLLPV